MGCINCKDDNKLETLSLQNTPVFGFDNQVFITKVLSVYDGDTITIALPVNGKYFQFRCRVIGVDCAEIRTKNLEEKKIGLEAKNYLSNKILGKVVTAYFGKEHDARGRLLAKIVFEGEDVAEIMIKAGYGYAYHGEHKKEFREWYKN